MHIFNAGGSARWGPVPFMKKEDGIGRLQEGENLKAEIRGAEDSGCFRQRPSDHFKRRAGGSRNGKAGADRKVDEKREKRGKSRPHAGSQRF